MSKDLEEPTLLPLAPYAGLSYGTFDDELYVIGGLWADLGEGLSATFIRDGVNLHAAVDDHYRRHAFFLWVSLENTGLACSVALPPGARRTRRDPPGRSHDRRCHGNRLHGSSFVLNMTTRSAPDRPDRRSRTG